MACLPAGFGEVHSDKGAKVSERLKKVFDPNFDENLPTRKSFCRSTGIFKESLPKFWIRTIFSATDNTSARDARKPT